MRDLTNKALETCSSEGASYADIRIVTVKDQDITIKKGNIDVLNLSTIKGFGVRVIANGGWGFAGSYDLDSKEIERVAKLAVRIGKASGSTRKEPLKLVDVEVVEAKYETKVKKDPFSVPVEEKLEVLQTAEQRLAKGGEMIKVVSFSEATEGEVSAVQNRPLLHPLHGVGNVPIQCLKLLTINLCQFFIIIPFNVDK